MALYNDVLNELQYYILNEENMQKSQNVKLKTKLKAKSFEKEKYTINEVSKKVKNNIFIPSEQDTLFWCFYILKNGHANYETLYARNDVIARQIKIDCIDVIRKNKQIVKTYKFDTISSIENNLANEKMLNMQTFLTLCAIENINILFVKNNTCYELYMNDSETVFILSDLNNNKNNNYTPRYGFETSTTDNAKNVSNNLYKIDNIAKPIKAITSYKLSDLIEMYDKLVIETNNTITSKPKTKKELYESIIQHF